ncbi:DUF1963 domain-containing protein [Mesorhizobium sp.]|uniref:DUF1963 domain-containing protein n=1 Tax=Mesorhizobium sp. TaxID=1871066 RepID=UPI0025CCA328|nr:DUF1963 domain-containing protein [Mesorhizobium sp.]
MNDLKLKSNEIRVTSTSLLLIDFIRMFTCSGHFFPRGGQATRWQMIIRVLRKIFGKRKADQASREFAAGLVRGIVENEVATFEVLANARNIEEPYVLLTPVVPLPAQQSAGWFGGAPCLPDDVAWPEIEGEPLRFVCQIDLSALPQNIWSGLGPRKGWLAVFLHAEETAHAEETVPKVLHVDGELKWRDGPGQADAVWFRPRSSKGRLPVQAHTPRWPIMISEHVGQPPPPTGWRKGKAPGLPNPRHAQFPDLSNAAFHPFNEATLAALLNAIEDQFSLGRTHIDGLLKRKHRDEGRTQLESMQLEASRSMGRFSHIRDLLIPFTKDFQRAPIQDLLAQIADIPFRYVRYLKDDEDGYAFFSSSTLRLCEKPVGQWWYTYADQLYRHAVCAYTRAPETLHPELRSRMEMIWQFDALHERGAMGHAPVGHVYTPHGPATPNAVLLELRTSDMVGWIWGDMYSIVLFISRDDLANGNFDNVTFEITN